MMKMIEYFLLKNDEWQIQYRGSNPRVSKIKFSLITLTVVCEYGALVVYQQRLYQA